MKELKFLEEQGVSSSLINKIVKVSSKDYKDKIIDNSIVIMKMT